MKHDAICASCVKDCKQPASAKLVSCPNYERADRNLDMFDVRGNVRPKKGKGASGGPDAGPDGD